jgi:hypothetical protein
MCFVTQGVTDMQGDIMQCAAGLAANCSWRASDAAAVIFSAVLTKCSTHREALCHLPACSCTSDIWAAADWWCGSAAHHVGPEVVSVSIPFAAAAIPRLGNIKVGLSTDSNAGDHNHVAQCTYKKSGLQRTWWFRPANRALAAA